MRNALLVSTLLAVASVTAAVNDNELRVFFNTDSADPTVGTDPVLAPGSSTELSLWAEVFNEGGGADNWIGISLGLDNEGSFSISNEDIPNAVFGGALSRWNGAQISENGDFEYVAVTSAGTGTLGLAGEFVANGASSFIRLGTFTFDALAPGEIRGEVLSGLFSQSAATGGDANSNSVFMGFGAQDPVDGKITGAAGSDAMITITPEPASLVLLALAGLALRRR